MDVIFKTLPGVGGDIGKILLTRPRHLNALNFPMCAAIYHQLQQWASQKSVKAVIIAGEGGRAFCAGGDVRAVYECVKQKKLQEVEEFFYQEYAMNQAISSFPKPYISFLDGITMGGGVGLSIHGSHAVATERLIWALPETRIGFFPDVGSGYHLAKFPDYIGYYLGLTGESVQAGDVYQLGLAKAVVASDKLAELEKTLIHTAFDSDNFNRVTDIIARFHAQPDDSLTVLKEKADLIRQSFSLSSVEEVLRSLEESEEQWCQNTAKLLRTRAPLSLKITYEHLQHCKNFEFSQVMKENICLAKSFIKNHDFMEGIRAAIIDKDQRPRWQPATLSEITAETLQGYFES